MKLIHNVQNFFSLDRMNYTPITEIEQWYILGQQNEHLDEFFQPHIEILWNSLTLLEIFDIIKDSKIAAYTAYQYDYANFKQFCDYTWEHKIIDYRFLPNMEIKQFIQIQNMFNAETIILPGNMPREILNHIEKGETLIFYTSARQYQGQPLIRPIKRIEKQVNLTINGNYNTQLTDPTIELLMTFQNIKYLILNSICINQEKIAVLKLNTIKGLILANCTIYYTKISQVIELLLDRDEEFKALQIAYKGFSPNLTRIIKEILNHIQISNIKILRISLSTTWDNLNLLRKNLPKSKINHLTIFKLRNRDNMLDHDFLERLKPLNIDVEIEEFKHENPQLKNKHWYS